MMRINKVVLKNYRSHVETEVLFDKGINLILGPNGAGKSSIIEAVGIALFDADARSNRSDAVRQGTKTAIIEVGFQANDGLDYVVEKRIGATNISKLWCEGDGAARIEGKEAVLSKVRQLTGLELNEKNLFQNVITAYQNKFVSIFTETPSRREELFNQIFDTAIYREMFDGYAKEATDGYKRKLDTVRNACERLESKRQDVALLKTCTKEKREAVKQLQEKVKQVEKTLAECNVVLSSLEQIRAAAQSTEASLAHKRELLATRREEEQKAKQRVGECEDARTKMGAHAPGYRRYCEISEHLRELGVKIEELEVLEKKVNGYREERNAMVSEKSGLVERGQLLQKNIEQAGLNQKETMSRIEAAEQEKETLCRRRDSIYHEGIKAREQLDEVKQLRKSCDEHTSAINHLDEKIKECTTSEDAVSGLEKKLTETKDKRAENEEQLKARLLLQQKAALLESRIKDNLKAKETLGQKICPILHETCANVSQKESVEDYFLLKDEQLRDELGEINKHMSVFADLSERISANETLFGRLEHQLEEEKNKRRQKEMLLKDKRIAEKDLEILKNKVDVLISGFPEEIKTAFGGSKDIHQLVSLLEERVSELRAAFSQQKAMVESNTKELQNLHAQHAKVLETESELGRQLTKTAKRLRIVDESIVVKEEVIERDQKALTELPLLRETRKKHETEAACCKHDYDTYIAFGQKAQELDQACAHVKRVEAQVDHLRKEEEQLQGIYRQHMAQWDEPRYVETKTLIDEQNREKVSLQEQTAEAATALALAQRDLEDALGIEKELKSLSREAAMVERKLEVSRQFRSNLSGMGKFIASRLMNRIEVLATEHFRSITGRPESVKWVNNDTDAYAVYLHAYKSEQPRSFEILSGGEQVAVALAIRSAMAGLLTSANIALFDEPTINLDSERKTALAESLRGMLKDLEQAIIVTHDDVFREMAQKTIVL